jgi:hypothetical protein
MEPPEETVDPDIAEEGDGAPDIFAPSTASPSTAQSDRALLTQALAPYGLTAEDTQAWITDWLNGTPTRVNELEQFIRDGRESRTLGEQTALLRVLGRLSSKTRAFLLGKASRCPEFVLERTNGVPTRIVKLDDDMHLIEVTWPKDRKGAVIPNPIQNVIVSEPLILERFIDQDGGSQFLWHRVSGHPPAIVEGRYSLRNLLDTLSATYRLPGQQKNALAHWSGNIPIAGDVRTRLEWVWDPIARRFWVPPVFAEDHGERLAGAAFLVPWYRPLAEEDAMALLQRLLKILTPKQMVWLAWAVGAPIARFVDPNRPGVDLDLQGMSGAGKTLGMKLIIAIVWALGADAGEYFGSGATKTEFTGDSFSGCTNFPLLNDEKIQNKVERAKSRSRAGGGTTARGGTDLLMKKTVPLSRTVRTANPETDHSESTLSEVKGDTPLKEGLPADGRSSSRAS